MPRSNPSIRIHMGFYMQYPSCTVGTVYGIYPQWIQYVCKVLLARDYCIFSPFTYFITPYTPYTYPIYPLIPYSIYHTLLLPLKYTHLYTYVYSYRPIKIPLYYYPMHYTKYLVTLHTAPYSIPIGMFYIESLYRVHYVYIVCTMQGNEYTQCTMSILSMYCVVWAQEQKLRYTLQYTYSRLSVYLMGCRVHISTQCTLAPIIDHTQYAIKYT